MLINSYRFAVASTYDTDARAYITAVETADALSLETATKDAINAFVVGCKDDGIWTAIKASCILAGARTLAGALVPLVGTAPTNVGGLFVAGDYNRKTGLVGNGSTKYLDSNRAGNADPQNSFHASVFVSTAQAGTTGKALMGAIVVSPAINRVLQLAIDSGRDIAANRSLNILSSNRSPNSFATGFLGTTRPSSTAFDFRFSGTQLSKPETSLSAPNLKYYVFAQNLSNTLSAPTDARIAFYSIGESLDLAALDTRVTALITAFSTAIP